LQKESGLDWDGIFALLQVFFEGGGGKAVFSGWLIRGAIVVNCVTNVVLKRSILDG
jgi:hypothetical protein